MYKCGICGSRKIKIIHAVPRNCNEPNFSFNEPYAVCPKCGKINADYIIPAKQKIVKKK